MAEPPAPRPGLVIADVDDAVGRLHRGGLVALPTETVYGLGADASDASAVARIFEVKGRPPGHPLIVHLAGPEQLAGWASSIPRAARVLTEACWPGPLTVLLERGRRVLDVVTGGRQTVGLRVPSHPVTLDVLVRFGGGIAAPSANRFGQVSPTTAQHVVDDIGELLDPTRDAVLDGGPTPIGVESTIVDCTVEPPQILRPGGIPDEDIARLLDGELGAAAGAARASGMLESHYSPRCEVRVADSRAEADELAATLRAAGRHVEMLDGSDDLVAYASRLYRELRQADALALDVVVAVLPPARGLGHAIRDRLTKAAAGSSRPRGERPTSGPPDRAGPRRRRDDPSRDG
ncbi:MAG: L-threonylcarbamoyladenylate synthase [Ilumatobacteraceae bacterium]